jgi:lysyl-tRNA synthetase class 2
MTKNSWQSTASNEMLLERALMLKSIRAFFDDRGVIEVETPLLSKHSTTEPHLDSLQSCFREQTCYLNTSPEYAMKRLLAGWKKPIYQIAKAFRNDELGHNHNPEFTLLEWYRPDYDILQLMDEVSELVFSLCGSVSGPAKFTRMSYQQAFERFAGFDPHHVTSAECFKVATKNNIEIPQGLTAIDEVNDWLDWLLTQMVLPAFSKDGFTFLYDYPASQSSLARIVNNPQQVPVARRFELFFGEIELANGFHELTDADEQLQRFQSENQTRKQLAKEPGCIDINLIEALRSGLPDCSGVALGLDRLLMVKTACKRIDQVLAFSWDSA